MKCFKIDEGGEYFYYAAESADAALKEHREVFAPDFDEDDSTVTELSDERMGEISIRLEDEDESLGEKTTLKLLFDRDYATATETAYIAGSVF